MYTHCIFCKAQLGSNQVIERFPVGRRLAFDAAQGRLWVVCRSCNRWNLTPIEERWEAIEECERLYRDTRTRLATEHIGLARVAEGTDLVRIGNPQRPEFAAWRYGEQLVNRRRREMMTVGVSVAAGVALLVTGGAMIGFASMASMNSLVRAPHHIINAVRGRRKVAVLIDDSGRTRHCTARNLRGTRLSIESDGLLLSVPHRDGELEISGPRALQSAATILPHVNYQGARTKEVDAAVQLVQVAVSLEDYFVQVARNTTLTKVDRKYKEGGILSVPAPMRLALEMMSHEDQERRVLEGELHELEAMWREAEEIASISDNLFLPRSVTEFLRKNKEKP